MQTGVAASVFPRHHSSRQVTRCSAILLLLLACASVIFYTDLFAPHPDIEVLSMNSIEYKTGDTSNRAGMFTPYGITPGGGEKYFLTVTAALQHMGYDVDILVDWRNVCDQISKLKDTADALRVPLDFTKLRLVRMHRPERKIFRSMTYEAFFSIGNSKFPEWDPIGTKFNIWMCQFPFDLNRTFPDMITKTNQLSRLAGYDVTLVNSVYSQGWYATFIQPYLEDMIASNRPIPSLEVLYPPVNAFPPPTPGGKGARKLAPDAVFEIVLLGRFFRGRQSKGHDVALQVLQEVMKRSSRRFHLSLIGNIHPEEAAYAYVDELKAIVAVNNLPVSFVTNASPEQISDALAMATVMWHLTGTRDDENQHDPASKEHFGIAIAEAMSAGCIPVVTLIGGPSDIVSHDVNGYLASSIEDYVKYTVDMSNLPESRLLELSKAAIGRAEDFSVEHFVSRFALLGHQAMLSKTYRQFANKKVAQIRPLIKKVSPSSKLSAVIIETGISPLFEFSVRNVMLFLGPNWRLQVFYSERNEAFIRYSLKDIENVDFKPLPAKMVDSSDYNQLLKSSAFWSSLNAEKVLLFQTDTLMIRNGMKHFMEYDYLSSETSNVRFPVQNTQYSLRDMAPHTGISLRSVRAMISICEKHGRDSDPIEPEDLFFARHIESEGLKLPPDHARDRFCPFILKGNSSSTRLHHLAVHAPWYYLPSRDLTHFYDLSNRYMMTLPLTPPA